MNFRSFWFEKKTKKKQKLKNIFSTNGQGINKIVNTDIMNVTKIDPLSLIHAQLVYELDSSCG